MIKIDTQVWIVFIKSINVGSHNILPMSMLHDIGNALSYDNFKTYIQSGNCVFTSSQTDGAIIEAELGKEIFNKLGFHPLVFALSASTLNKAIEQNPYQVESTAINKVHLLFSKPGNIQFDKTQALRLATPDEAFEHRGTILYMHAPGGVGRSKLFAKLPLLLGQKTTARNLKTVKKVYEMATPPKYEQKN